MAGGFSEAQISEWRLHANGTIRPRFGFAGPENRRTCHLHAHHVYWRFNFDIRTPRHNVVEEFNDPPSVGNHNWHTKQFEICQLRGAAHKRRWHVRNTLSGEAYDIVPGPHDGVPTAYRIAMCGHCATTPARSTTGKASRPTRA